MFLVARVEWCRVAVEVVLVYRSRKQKAVAAAAAAAAAVVVAIVVVVVIAVVLVVVLVVVIVFVVVVLVVDPTGSFLIKAILGALEGTSGIIGSPQAQHFCPFGHWGPKMLHVSGARFFHQQGQLKSSSRGGHYYVSRPLFFFAMRRGPMLGTSNPTLALDGGKPGASKVHIKT